MFLFRKSVNIIRSFSKYPTLETSSKVEILKKSTAKLERLSACDEDEISILSPNSAKNYDFSDHGPQVVPTFNLAAYANRSVTLQKLIDLGVDLSKIEKRKGLPEFVVKLEFERDIKNHIQFLCDIGITPDELGTFLTTNPLIFKEDLENLRIRVQFLMSKRYTPEMITNIVLKNPYWLMFNIDRLERRLEFFKEHFSLWSDNMLQQLVCKGPKLITYNIWSIKVNSVSVLEEMGFTDIEMKRMLLSKPKIWMINNKSLVGRFNVLHNEMKVPQDLISRQAGSLLCRSTKVRQRHLFLKDQEMAQYNPKLPNYVSLIKLVSGTDAEFSVDVAKSSYSKYLNFLKTL